MKVMLRRKRSNKGFFLSKGQVSGIRFARRDVPSGGGGGPEGGWEGWKSKLKTAK